MSPLDYSKISITNPNVLTFNHARTTLSLLKEASTGRPLIKWKKKHGKKVAHDVFGQGKQDRILLSSYNLIKLSDDCANNLIPEAEYRLRACDLWNLISDDRAAIEHTSQFLSGVPPLIIATLLLPLKRKYLSLNLQVGTEVRCISGMRTDNAPDVKNQDVAISVQTTVGDKRYNLGLSTYECKENYIDANMANSPNSKAVGSLAVCDFSKAEVFSPTIEGNVDFDEQLTVRHFCHNDPNVAHKRHRDGHPHRVFDTDMLAEMVEDAETHIASLTPQNISDWTMCPSYSVFKARKAFVTVDGDQEAIAELARLTA